MNLESAGLLILGGKMNFEKSCGVIIYRQEAGEIEFLAVKSRGNGHWGFPKGHIEKGESEVETASREVYEETGLCVNLIDGFRKCISYPLSEDTLKEVVFFIGRSAAGVVSIQPEKILEFRWANYRAIKELLTYENIKEILKEANDFLLSSVFISIPKL